MIIKEQPLLLPRKQVFWPKIGFNLKEIALLWKESNSGNSLVDWSTKGKKTKVLGTYKISELLEINFAS